jgi:hypothetical protein
LGFLKKLLPTPDHTVHVITAMCFLITAYFCSFIVSEIKEKGRAITTEETVAVDLVVPMCHSIGYC